MVIVSCPAAESGSPGSAGHAYPTYLPQSGQDIDQPQYARASAPMWTMDVTGRMVPLPYSPNIPLEAGGNEARADAMRRRQQLFNSVSSVGQDEASLARASAGVLHYMWLSFPAGSFHRIIILLRLIWCLCAFDYL